MCGSCGHFQLYIPIWLLDEQIENLNFLWHVQMRMTVSEKNAVQTCMLNAHVVVVRGGPILTYYYKQAHTLKQNTMYSCHTFEASTCMNNSGT